MDETQPAFLAVNFALRASAPANTFAPIAIGLPTNRYDSFAAVAPTIADWMMIGFAIRPPIRAPFAASFTGIRLARAVGRRVSGWEVVGRE